MLPAPASKESSEPQGRALLFQDLLAKADEYGIAESHMIKAAPRYCNGRRLDQLNADEMELLYNRLVASREQSADKDTDVYKDTPTARNTAVKSDKAGGGAGGQIPAREISVATGEQQLSGDRGAVAQHKRLNLPGQASDRGEGFGLESMPSTTGARSNGREGSYF